MNFLTIAVLFLVTFVGTLARAERVYQRTTVRTSAAEDAAEMARSCRFGHRGTAGCREGIGCGATPEQALGNCCFNNGRYTIKERAVVRGRDGRWYAVIRYAD